MSEVLDNKDVQKIYIDARGPRFSASITTVIVLAIALVTQNKWVLVAQGLVFPYRCNPWSAVHSIRVDL